MLSNATRHLQHQGFAMRNHNIRLDAAQETLDKLHEHVSELEHRADAIGAPPAHEHHITKRDDALPRVAGHSNYEATHGHKPRGSGSWAFKHEGGKLHNQISWHHGTFSQASKAAQKHGAEHGSHAVHVQT